MFHYTYRITNLVKNKHYYGVRSSKINPNDDIGIIYFSSSKDKDFLQDQKDNPNNYKYKVIYIYKTRKQAALAEIKLHDKFNVGINESFYNLAKSTTTKFNFKVTPEIAKKSAMNTDQKAKGQKIKEVLKNSLKKPRGKNCYQSKHIQIFNNKDGLIFDCFGNYKKVCQEHKIPLSKIRESFRNNTKLSFNYNSKRSYFDGWYAIEL